MIFTPKSDQELSSMNLIDPGSYKFKVVEAKDRVSKAGSDMIELKLSIIDNHDRERFVFDYLLEAMVHKLKHFTDTCDLTNKYQDGSLLAQDCLYKTGVAEIIIQKSKDPAYGDKNSVRDYITSDTIPVIKTEGKGSDFFDDDITF